MHYCNLPIQRFELSYRPAYRFVQHLSPRTSFLRIASAAHLPQLVVDPALDAEVLAVDLGGRDDPRADGAEGVHALSQEPLTRTGRPQMTG